MPTPDHRYNAMDRIPGLQLAADVVYAEDEVKRGVFVAGRPSTRIEPTEKP